MSTIKITGTGAPGSSLKIVGGSGLMKLAPIGGPASQVVGSAGGSISVTGNVVGTISIPAGALASDVTITATSVSSSGVSIPSSNTVGALLQMGPEGQTFAQPITITIAVDLASLPAGVTINDLVIYTAPVGSGTYTALTTTVVDPTHISAQVSHFSNFAIAHPQVGTQALPKAITPGLNSVETFDTDVGQSFYFKFNVPNGNVVHAYVGPGNRDTYVTVYDNGTQVAADDDSGGSDQFMTYNSHAIFTNNSGVTKTYVMAARAFGNNSLTGGKARVVLAAPAGAGAAPTIDTGLVAWYKADSITGASNGDVVQVWSDSSGAGQNMVGNPTYVAADSNLGGMPSLSFAGGKTMTEFFNGSFPSGSDARTMYVVGYLNNVSPAASAVSYGKGWNGARFGLFANDGKLYIETANFTSKGSTISNGGAFVAVYPYRAETRFNNNSLYVNSVKATQTELGYGGAYTAATANTKLSMGYLADGPGNSYNWDGAIAEVLIYNTEHDDYARERVESYLRTKYGFSYTMVHANSNVGLASFLVGGVPAVDGSSVNVSILESTPGSGSGTLTVNVTTSDANASITDGSGNAITVPYTVSVSDGDAINVSFTVVAADGTTTQQYSTTANVNLVTNLGSGTFADPYVVTLDGETRTFEFDFDSSNIANWFINGGNSQPYGTHGMYFKFNVPASMSDTQKVKLLADVEWTPSTPWYNANHGQVSAPTPLSYIASQGLSEVITGNGAPPNYGWRFFNFDNGLTIGEYGDLWQKPEAFAEGFSSQGMFGLLPLASAPVVGTTAGDWIIAVAGNDWTEGFTHGVIRVKARIV